MLGSMPIVVKLNGSERVYIATVRRNSQRLDSSVSVTRVDAANAVWYAQRRSYRDLRQRKRRDYWVTVV